MHEYFFTFSSVTAAQHAQLILSRHQIVTELTRMPKRFSPLGCSNALRVRYEDARSAAKVLRVTRVFPNHIIKIDSNGNAGEVYL